MNTENSRPDEEEVLHAFSVEPRHDRATLDRKLRLDAMVGGLRR